MTTAKASRAHDETIVEMLRADQGLPTNTWPRPWTKPTNPAASRPC
ncbi:hypothetical protein ACT80S_03535 [Ramlibacter sp. MAHUQ-53]